MWIPEPGDPDAIHDNVAGEIAALDEKSTPVDADLVIIEDSEDSNSKKKVQVGNLPGDDPDAIHDNVAGEIAALDEKSTPVDADLVIIEDSEDSNSKKKVQVGNLPGGGGGGNGNVVEGGTDTIPDGQTTIAVEPFIVGKLEAVTVSPAAVEPLAVSALDEAEFTVERAGSTGDLDFYWIAVVDPTPPAVWDDAAFLWSPNPTGRSQNLVGGTTDSSDGLTEGTPVTQSGRAGREYSGAVGSRFPVSTFSVAPPNDTTVMVVVSADQGGGIGIWFGVGNDTNQYAAIQHNLVEWRSDGAGSAGSDEWPRVTWASLPSGLSVIVAQFTSTGETTGVLEGRVNGVDQTPDNFSDSSPLSVNRITIGRGDRASSPSNSSGIRVFAAAMWTRALTNSEIATVEDDPFEYLS